MKIDGSVKGDVTFGLTDGLCIVSAGALVEGNLRGPRALILGEVQGTWRCRLRWFRPISRSRWLGEARQLRRSRRRFRHRVDRDDLR